jgi:hypothetical protein
VNTQYGIPVIVGPTAVSAPKFYAYLASHQLTGMLGGMKGAAEYEQLLGRSYPALGDLYRSARFLTATKAMDSQTGIHLRDRLLDPDRERGVLHESAPTEGDLGAWTFSESGSPRS